MPHKVLQALGSSFQRGDVAAVDEPSISRAEAAGLTPPALSPAEQAGVGVQAALASKYLASLSAVEQYQRERADYERKRDDALWTQIQARQTI